MKKLNQVITKNQILELQKQETITLELTKKECELIGFSIGSEIDNFTKAINGFKEDLKNDKIVKTESDIKLIEDTINSMQETINELYNMRENLKKFYGLLID